MQKLLVVSLAAVVVAAGLAYANEDSADHLIVPRAQWLSASQSAPTLAVQGHQVHEVEVDDKTCKLAATNSTRARPESNVRLASGEVVQGGLLCCRPCLAGRLDVPRAQWLSASEVKQKLAAQGYQVHEIEVDGGAYEFEATSSGGARIEGHADPATGEAFLRGLLCCERCLEA